MARGTTVDAAAARAGEVAGLTMSMVRSDSDRDLDAIASRIETAASAYSQWPGALAGRLSVWVWRPWLGIRLPRMLNNP